MIEELARSATGDVLGVRRSLTLESLLGERVARLPDDAPAMLRSRPRIVAIGGPAITLSSTVSAASDTPNYGLQALVALLRTAIFVRAVSSRRALRWSR